MGMDQWLSGRERSGKCLEQSAEASLVNCIQEEDLKKKIVHTLMCRTEAVQSYEIIKQSLDARKKPELFYVYTVDVKADNEKQLLKMLTRKKRAGNVQLHEAMPYVFPAGGNEKLKSRPVVVGCGPAGLFCAYFLAEYGYQPVLLERGTGGRTTERC